MQALFLPEMKRPHRYNIKLGEQYNKKTEDWICVLAKKKKKKHGEVVIDTTFTFGVDGTYLGGTFKGP